VPFPTSAVRGVTAEDPDESEHPAIIFGFPR